MNTWEIRQGDALERLREMPDRSVQTCITSPPYFGLRDYGTGSWEGGVVGCDHISRSRISESTSIGRSHGGTGETQPHVPSASLGVPYRDTCGKCGATRVDNQIGLEPTPDEYVTKLVEVFREVRRVLRDDGTLWLNLGDSYAGSGPSGASYQSETTKRRAEGDGTDGNFRVSKSLGERGLTYAEKKPVPPPGYKPKDLLGIPWTVAFALRQDGWYLRSDIIWAKPNPMPESVTDRPTKAHEYLFLLSKSKTYYYDNEVIREEGKDWSTGGPGTGIEPTHHYGANNGGNEGLSGLAARYKDGTQTAGRNKRSVWTVATQPFPGAHFAVFPPKLIEPCVLAGSSDKACGVCGAPWRRVVERGEVSGQGVNRGQDAWANPQGFLRAGKSRAGVRETETVGWEPSCDANSLDCTLGDRKGSCIVLDPFAGAGTTGLVATRHGRSFIGIELNPEYAEMARQRIRDDAPLINYIWEAA